MGRGPHRRHQQLCQRHPVLGGGRGTAPPSKAAYGGHLGRTRGCHLHRDPRTWRPPQRTASCPPRAGLGRRVRCWLPVACRGCRPPTRLRAVGGSASSELRIHCAADPGCRLWPTRRQHPSPGANLGSGGSVSGARGGRRIDPRVERSPGLPIVAVGRRTSSLAGRHAQSASSTQATHPQTQDCCSARVTARFAESLRSDRGSPRDVQTSAGHQEFAVNPPVGLGFAMLRSTRQLSCRLRLHGRSNNRPQPWSTRS